MAKQIKTTYTFDPKDWVIGQSSKLKLYGNLICPSNAGKVAKTILFTCKENKQKKSIWKFKGDPADTSGVKCKPIPN